MFRNPMSTNPVFTPQATRLSANGIAEKVRHLQEDLQQLIKDEDIQDAAGGGSRSPRVINCTGQRTRADVFGLSINWLYRTGTVYL